MSSKKREAAIAKHQHICMVLNDDSFNGDSFEFRSNSSLLQRYPSDDVFVSTLMHIRSLSTIAVGFNFGGIQLWNLQQLTLQYTIADHSFHQSVVSFAFQEPENDPRNFCYLWVIKGHHQQESFKPENITVAMLYSLTYYRREWINSFGPFYTELQNCNKRFEYPLSTEPFSPLKLNASFASRLVSCQVVHQMDIVDVFGTDAVSQGESDCNSEDLSLCFMAWEVWPTVGDSPTACYLILFDINQWYQAQMPSSFRCEPTELSSYLGIFSLQRVSQRLKMRSLLGFHAIPHSIKKFKCLTSAEEFFFPSSLSFRICCFSASDLIEATYFGFQRQLLFELVDDGPKHLVNPKEMYTSFHISGMLSDAYSGPDRNLPLPYQREVLMQLALENHLPNFFMRCMQEFRYNDTIVQEGCSSRALLSWGWKKVISIKSSIDKLSQPLFNCSGVDIDKTSLKLLYSFKRQLDLIDSIFMGYQKYVAPRTDQEIQEIQLKKDVIFSINMYLQVLLWLRYVHILPEVCEGDEREDTVMYPASALTRFYSTRRLQLQEIHCSIGSTDLLLVDGLVTEAAISSIWQEKGGLGTYPPPGIYAALSFYLVDGITLQQKHTLMYYLFLDIMSLLPDRQVSLITELKKFFLVFNISHSNAKLTKAFWYLDHQDFENAIKKLLEPGVKASDILPWQHRRIIKSFLFQGEPHKALRYINHMEPPETTIEDMKLRLSVLLARGSVTRAFDYQREKQNDCTGEELLNHLLLGCQETRSLRILMYLPLNPFETSTLVKFLYDNEDPRAQEMLVLYYLLRCNFFEAAKINDKIAANSVGKCMTTQERAPYRDALVESFLNAVPRVEKKLAEELSCLPIGKFKKESSPRPLSVTVANDSRKQIAYSDLLNSAISQASSSHMDVYHQPQTPLKSRSQSCYDSIPFLRPAITPECNRQPSVLIKTTPLSKRNLSPSTSNEFTSPTKKSRLLDNGSFKITDSVKRRTPKHLVRDIASLLQTPPIHRRTPKSLNESPVPATAVTTPHSILKKYVRPPIADALNLYTASTPSVCSLDDDMSDVEITDISCKIPEDKKTLPDAESHSRQIRFQVPSSEKCSPEPFGQELLVSDEKTKHFSPLVNPLTVSARQSLETHSAEKYISPQVRESFADVPNESLVACHEESFTFVPQETELVQPMESSVLPKETSAMHINESALSQPHDSVIQTEMLFPEQSHESIPLQPVESSTVLLRKSLIFQPTEKLSTTIQSKDSLSSSSSSSYNSASERSFIASPRRPLRDTSRNISTINVDNSYSIPTALPLEATSGESAATAKLPLSSEIALHICSTNLPNQSQFEVESDIDVSDENFESPNISLQVLDQAVSGERSTVCLDLMSKHSDLCENKFLQEADGLLKTKHLDNKADNINNRTEKKYVFSSKNFSTHQTKDKEKQNSSAKCISKEVIMEDMSKDVVESSKQITFLENCESTYEEFSRSLKKETPAVKTDESHIMSKCDNKMNESSPCSENIIKKSSIEIAAPKLEENFKPPQVTSVKKKVTTAKKASLLEVNEAVQRTSGIISRSSSKAKTTKSTRRKSKLEGSISQKIDFSFAEPHSPAGPEILEALASTPEYPVPSFVFSPPATRARVRQKKLDETMGSSFASCISEKSFTRSKKPPMDPLLQEIMQERATEGCTNFEPSTSSYSKKKSSTLKTSADNTSLASVRKSMINLISPMPGTSDLGTASRRLTTTRHAMVLRRTLKKKKSVKLF